MRSTAKRGVLVESEMSANAIVIVGVGAEDPAQMGLAHDQDMVAIGLRQLPSDLGSADTMRRRPLGNEPTTINCHELWAFPN